MGRALAAALCVLLSGCVQWGLQPGEVEVPPGLAVPDEVYQAAYVFAARHVGPEAFERLYRVNASSTGPAMVFDCAPAECHALARLPHDRVVFDVVLPDGSLGTKAEVAVWPDNATVVPFDEDRPHDGFPDCRRRPLSCWFLVDADEARALAERAGLEPRGCPLRAELGWSAHLQRHAWQVTEESCPPVSEEGRVLSIDVATGRVVASSSYFLIID